MLEMYRALMAEAPPELSLHGRAAHGSAYGKNYERLVEVKTKWDPGNLFRINKNIAPRVL